MGHWPMAYKEGAGLFPKAEEGSDRIAYTDTNTMDTWRGMEEAVRLGLTRSIGVSNFNKGQIERIRKEGSILPANIQIEIHPYLNYDLLFTLFLFLLFYCSLVLRSLFLP